MKYLILGAGPAGLTAANILMDRGEESFLVLEKETEAGGLCRSENVGAFPIDIGGGHFLDTRVTKAQEYILRFMPEEEWNRYSRSTKIDMYGTIIDNPIEAHIWQLPLKEQVEYIKSVAYAGANTGELMPKDFIGWIYWKLGSKIADEYMIPYNKKMFGRYLDQLGTYWLYKLPTVNLEDTILSCLEHKMYGKYPAHTEFFYPKKFGFGEVWNRMAERIKEHIVFEVPVVSIDCANRRVNDKYEADYIINTIPWTEFKEMKNCSEQVAGYCGMLPYTSLEVKYFSENIKEDYQWIYYPDLSIPYHRKFFRANYLEGASGGYYETNVERATVSSGWKHVNQYAYPCNTIDKPMMIQRILREMEESKIYGIGRWGEWEHLNADVVVSHAMELLRKI